MKTIHLMPLILLPLALLGGCSSMPLHNQGLAADPVPVAQGKNRQEMYVDLIRSMLAKHQNYAALANIEELEREGHSAPEVALLHAQVTARLGHNDEASQRYTALLGGPMDTEARHGLGRLLLGKNYTASLQYLQQAVAQSPTDPKLRNDYGYALMLGGCYVPALRQISTAQQLAPDNATYRNNALLSLLIAGHKAEFSTRSKAWKLGDQALAGLQEQAHNWPARVTALRGNSAAATTSCGNTATASLHTPAPAKES